MGRLPADVRSDVAAARRRASLTQRRLGELVGVSRQTVVEIEAGGYNPSTAVALRLAVALDTPVEQLFALPAAEADRIRARRDAAKTGGRDA
ncbi:helix-turn-helix transcriptional regulator [Pseudonocardia sp. ICBG1293]|uniref:helix-turn-helix transcriptional regulator n=1 Tax=Pseudonocardia sp. ICBG1293 TaxID=2844382 RepID=UPI001CCBFE24|nr:helix-turn-helix transcriptional regulator [Pseudonocardia sp. ICBG1293]